MEVERLNQSELIYEFRIRGVEPTGNVEQLRKLLRSSLKVEKRGKTIVFPPNPYTFEEDVKGIRETLAQLGDLVENFDDSIHGGTYKKIETKFSHVEGRIKRLIEDANRTETVDEFTRRISSLKNLLTSASKKFEDSLLLVDKDDENANLALESWSEIKPIPPNKWNLKFSGDKLSISVSAFLERVEELRIARNVSYDMLYNSAVDLFEGKALVWFRAYKSLVSDWDELTKLLRDEFQPHDYNEKLLSEIKNRTQGPDESIGVYVAVV
ncbi:hypothetical protein RN001_001042 [Aquatica leii]|uniref:Retrotransposon gag domain-containing protein n=1 Tax=Aquatica leii TaxID=1421715 RepID=A0AAN7PKT5_9COLE|nr:hypothetical protein RN001_001042 [Aquatica leii]